MTHIETTNRKTALDERASRVLHAVITVMFAAMSFVMVLRSMNIV